MQPEIIADSDFKIISFYANNFVNYSELKSSNCN